ILLYIDMPMRTPVDCCHSQREQRHDGISRTKNESKMIQRQLKLRLNARQECQLLDWLFQLTGVWNWALRKIELDARDGIFYTPKDFHNLLANHSKKLD